VNNGCFVQTCAFGRFVVTQLATGKDEFLTIRRDAVKLCNVVLEIADRCIGSHAHAKTIALERLHEHAKRWPYCLPYACLVVRHQDTTDTRTRQTQEKTMKDKERQGKTRKDDEGQGKTRKDKANNKQASNATRTGGKKYV
jgi:hypothetical protein